MANLKEKLLAVQTELKAPKDKDNDFGHYKYRSAESILEAVKPLLKEQGLVLNLTDELVLIGDRFYIKATATVADTAKSDEVNEVVKSVGYARESLARKGQDESQITGTTSSYARKYALNGLFLIDDSKDADTNEYHEENEARAKTPETKITFGMAQELELLAEEAGSDIGKMKQFYKVEKLTDLTEAQYKQAKSKLQSNIKKKEEAKHE